MKIINTIGRILGFVSSVFIIISLFITKIEIKALNIHLYSMSLIDHNRIGSVIIIGLAMLSLATIYFGKGFLTSLFSIIIVVADFYCALSLNTGSADIDTTIHKMSFLFGDIFSPESGFILVIIGAVVLFFSGVIIRKSQMKMKDKANESKA